MAFLIFFFYNLTAKSRNCYYVLVLLYQIVKGERLVSNITFDFIALGMKRLFHWSQGEVICQKQNDTCKRLSYLILTHFLKFKCYFFLGQKATKCLLGNKDYVVLVGLKQTTSLLEVRGHTFEIWQIYKWERWLIC